jgi:hypothetical protein
MARCKWCMEPVKMGDWGLWVHDRQGHPGWRMCENHKAGHYVTDTGPKATPEWEEDIVDKVLNKYLNEA